MIKGHKMKVAHPASTFLMIDMLSIRLTKGVSKAKVNQASSALPLLSLLLLLCRVIIFLRFVLCLHFFFIVAKVSKVFPASIQRKYYVIRFDIAVNIAYPMQPFESPDLQT